MRHQGNHAQVSPWTRNNRKLKTMTATNPGFGLLLGAGILPGWPAGPPPAIIKTLLKQLDRTKEYPDY